MDSLSLIRKSLLKALKVRKSLFPQELAPQNSTLSVNTQCLWHRLFKYNSASPRGLLVLRLPTSGLKDHKSFPVITNVHLSTQWLLLLLLLLSIDEFVAGKPRATTSAHVAKKGGTLEALFKVVGDVGVDEDVAE